MTISVLLVSLAVSVLDWATNGVPLVTVSVVTVHGMGFFYRVKNT